MEVEIIEISTDNFVDPRQIGWIGYKEGDAVIRVKVIRGSRSKPFLSHVLGFRHAVKVRIVEYQNECTWQEKSESLLSSFRAKVGDCYFFGANPGEVA